jgi:hypothetical protein
VHCIRGRAQKAARVTLHHVLILIRYKDQAGLTSWAILVSYIRIGMDARHGGFLEDKANVQGHLHSDSPTARALRDIAFGSVSPGLLSRVAPHKLGFFSSSSLPAWYQKYSNTHLTWPRSACNLRY